jgi:glycosyltransferase involved in cell wall biosynthesis
VRIVAWVINDVTRDSRVLREAATLAAAGHDVTVMGVARGPDEAPGSREEADGFTIIRVPIPRGAPWWMTWVRMPWVSMRMAAAAAVARLRRGDVGGSLRLLAGVVASIPWLAVRAAWVLVVNKALRRPVRLAGLEYIRHWRVEQLGWGRAALAFAPTADVHHAHDFEALPTALRAAGRDRALVVYDSHEIFGTWGPILRQPRWLRWAMKRWQRRLAPRAAAMVTINEPIADILSRRLGVRRPIVVHNASARWMPPDPPEDRIRHAAGIPSDAPVVLCHGGFQANRGLEETAEAMLEPGLEGAHLVFLGYRVNVIEPILQDPRLAGRVHYLPAVPPSDVLAWVSGADVDVMAILPADENSRLSTPNKLFESLAAGVPVVSSDFPERRRIVAGDPLGPLGALCDPADPRSIAAALRSVLDRPPAERAELRARCLRAAHERWNWETEGARLVALYAELERSRGSRAGAPPRGHAA